MGIRTVPLVDETEVVLEEVMERTGWSVTASLKRGLMVLRQQIAEQTQQAPYDVYERLDLGPGGYAIVPSTETRRGMKKVPRRKARR